MFARPWQAGTAAARRPIVRWLLPILCALLVPVGAAAQSTTEIIRGRIFRADSVPIAGADVTVTGLATQATLATRTDAHGVYTLLFTNPEGDYLVSVRAIGYAPANFRLTRIGISSILRADLYLKSIAFMLDTLEVIAQRPVPKGESQSIGGIELNALLGSLFLLDRSDLLSLALSVPGIMNVGDSSFSVLGAASNQNVTTVDGATFNGSHIPQDAQSSVKVVVSSADPARGGFAGGNVSAGMRGGSDIFAANARGNFANQTLAWADPDWPSPVPRIGGLSGSAGGPIRKKKSHYLFAWEAGDNAAEWYSLNAPRASLLAQQGILLDTVAAVSNTLTNLGVPLTLSYIPTGQELRRYNTSLVLDFAPKATTAIRITHSGYWTRGSFGSGVVPINAYQTRANDEGSTFHFISAKLSGYVHGLLDELTTSINYTHDHSDPYANLPAGSVRIGTQFADGRTGLATLLFAGGSTGHRSTGTLVEAINELSWIPRNSTHRVKIGERLAFDWSSSLAWQGNLNGNYTYQSLVDLQTNRPASFDRLLTTYQRSSHASNSALWVGDEWVASKAWQFQGGFRLDFAHPGTKPDYNPEVEQLFGLKTDRIPNDIGMSPRLGFSWSSPARRGRGSSGGSSSLGGLGARELASLPPELVMMMMGGQRASTLPGISVSGTVGGYRGVTSTSAIAGLVDRTGLPGTRTLLSCVGDAVPIPDWSILDGNPPSACLDGTGPGVFSVAQPTVQVYDPAYRAPLSWRANVGIDGIRLMSKWVMALSGTYAYNTNGQSSLDLNLNRTPGFSMEGEGNRPVYVLPSAIVPATGVIAPGASRIFPQYASVSNTISDLSGYNTQLQATLNPPHPILNNKVNLTLTYTLAGGSSDQRGGIGGFTRVGTAGDPFLKERIRSAIPTHQFRLTGSARAWWFNLSVSALAQSGIPFTPLVAGDVNGDGSSFDDRAFIPDPASTTDPLLAGQMREFLSNAPAGARNCIHSQLGRVAGPNTCTMPWQARLDLNLNFQPPSSWGYGDRLRVTMNMLNASGALVRLLHLENTPLGQYSLTTQPNATLLYVTGFDPATQRYQYQVNQLFGEPANFGTARHKFPPFQLQMGVEYKLGGPPTNPMSRSMGFLAQNKQPKLSDAQLRLALSRLKKDPVTTIVLRKDSLALTPDQLTKLAAVSAEFQARADTAIAPLTEYVLKKRGHVTDAELAPKLSKVQGAITKAVSQATTRAQGLLTAAQVSQLSRPVAAPPGAAPAKAGGATPQGTPPAPGAAKPIKPPA